MKRQAYEISDRQQEESTGFQCIGGVGSFAVATAGELAKGRVEIDFSVFEMKDYDKNGFVSVRIDDHGLELAQKTLKFEQTLWKQKGYGSLEEYNQEFMDQTRLFAAFSGEECIGVVRVFAKGYSLPPFISKMNFYDPEFKSKQVERFMDSKLEELGTVAVKNSKFSREVARNLWRLAYIDGKNRGVESWGLIMEPRRVKAMSKWYGFNTYQVGPEIIYQGGECAPHMIDFSDPVDRKRKPESHRWFIEEQLSQ